MNTTTPQPGTGAPTSKPSPAAPRDYHFPHFERRALANGIQLLVAPVPKLPLVTVLAIVEAGASVEPRGQQGVAALTARLLVEGAIKERGVMMPEALDPEALMNNFSKEGLKIFVEKREVAEM